MSQGRYGILQCVLSPLNNCFCFHLLYRLATKSVTLSSKVRTVRNDRNHVCLFIHGSLNHWWRDNVDCKLTVNLCGNVEYIGMSSEKS